MELLSWILILVVGLAAVLMCWATLKVPMCPECGSKRLDYSAEAENAARLECLECGHTWEYSLL
jgi:ribosomal protein S27AE